MTVCTVAIEEIVIPEIRSNAVYSIEAFADLKESISSSGIQFRPVVRQLPDYRYELVDGLHRMKCWKELGHSDIEVDVETLTDEQAAIKHIVANHQRGESDPVGLSKVILKLKEQGKSAEDIGRLIGYSAGTVRQYATLASLPEAFQAAITEGKLKMVHVKEAFRLEDTNDVLAALAYAIQFSWSGPVIRNWVENRLAELQRVGSAPVGMQQVAQPPPAPNPELASMRQCLCCGGYSKAEETVWWTLCGGCQQSLAYLKTVKPSPWEAVLYIVENQDALIKELSEKEGKLKELSEKFIDLSLRLNPLTQPSPQLQSGGGQFTPAVQH
jgi:ParB/RepB/Spo0J family partition protein